MNEMFGMVETVGGILKLSLVIGTGIVMYHLYTVKTVASGDDRWYLSRKHLITLN